ncbi:MAG: hypothetical protein R2867_11585 [Caldilineaceae bacterium]
MTRKLTRWCTPSSEFPLGTDPFGRSLWRRIVYGARIPLAVALVVNVIAFVVGAPLGALAGRWQSARRWLNSAIRKPGF